MSLKFKYRSNDDVLKKKDKKYRFFKRIVGPRFFFFFFKSQQSFKTSIVGCYNLCFALVYSTEGRDIWLVGERSLNLFLAFFVKYPKIILIHAPIWFLSGFTTVSIDVDCASIDSESSTLPRLG